MDVAASLTLSLLHVALLAPFALLAVVVLQECAGCVVQETTRAIAPLWRAIRQFSLRSMFILTALASVGSLLMTRIRLRLSYWMMLEAVEDLFCLALFAAAIALGALLLHDLSIALGIIPRQTTR